LEIRFITSNLNPFTPFFNQKFTILNTSARNFLFSQLISACCFENKCKYHKSNFFIYSQALPPNFDVQFVGGLLFLPFSKK
jgi:hypothetical protein